MSTTTQKIIQVGTRVYTGLYNRGYGTVYAIHGEQTPHNVRHLFGGVMASGGNAKFDIVFDCGTTSLALPECILRGVQWRILDELASAEEIAAALANATSVAAQAKAVESERKAKFDAEVTRLKTDPQYAALEQGEDGSGKLAAANIRKLLKARWPKVKFSVRKDSYGSLRVWWADGPTVAAVEAVTGLFKGGYFDSMEDYYRPEDTPFNQLFGSFDYLSTSREISDELVSRAITALVDRYPGNFSERPTVEAYRAGQYVYICPLGGDTLQTMIRRECEQIEA